MRRRSLRVAAHGELVSLIVLLANLATAHLRPLSSLMGPLHGCAYLFVVIAVWRLDRIDTTARAIAVLPGIGGLLALRRTGRLGMRAHPVAQDGGG
ncbi:DUF3817 domain-containing protein [Streptomyces platensis]|uniref:DUF3817 domain-containing protein n=1 Tax=Streptomyces platensis TaxID=58346 RepID=UPI002E80ACF1|nr:DUF3817 domain-containing protein [Streptomyces platensis]WUB78730.1 DUF3817 domain-containing protein [Streptomyces platensis]